MRFVEGLPEGFEAMRPARTLTLDPEAVVLGGFLADLAEASQGRLQELVRHTGFAALAADVEVVPAALRTDVLTIGAAELIFADLLADPQAYALA